MKASHRISTCSILKAALCGLACAPFAAFSTGLGGALQINTSEQLSSSSAFLNLNTPDTLAVTLNGQSYVTIMYNSAVLKTGCIGSMLSVLSINGVQQPGSMVSSGLTLNSGGSNNINYTIQLPAGTHTFNIAHRVDGCTGYWYNRSLTILVHT